MFSVLSDNQGKITLDKIYSNLINTKNPKLSFCRYDDYANDESPISTEFADVIKLKNEICNINRAKSP